MKRAALVLFLLAACTPCAAQTDVEDSHDHPMFSRLPGYFISEYDAQDFSAFDFDLEPARKVEGRYWRIQYEMTEGARKVGPLQIARNHTDLFVKRGGTRLLEDVDSGGGTTIATLPAGGKTIWAQLEIYNSGEMFSLTVVEEAGMEQRVEFTAMELATTLKEKGSVALHNILFDTGKATLKPESAAPLATVGELLKNDPVLELEIQGHTDSLGNAAANLKLSKDRAASVRIYLIETLGLAPERLTIAGFGDTRPIGDNSTDAGRAENRRVELVRK